MEGREKKISAAVITVVLISVGVGAAILNLDKIQRFFEDLAGKDDTNGNNESEDLNNPDYQPGESKPVSETLKCILSSSSKRSIGSMTTLVSPDSEFFPLIGTPIAISYKGTQKDASPLLIEGDAASGFLGLYNSTGIITIGDVGGVTADHTFSGSERSASLNAAKKVWSYSDGALIIENSEKGYEIGLVAAPLTAYLNIPVIVTTTMDSSVVETLSGLGVTYTLICGCVEEYGETYYLPTIDDALDLCVEFLNARFGKVSYITLTNSEDVQSQYGISELSCLAPYLSSFYGGLVLNCPISRLPSNIFDEPDESIAFTVNETIPEIKTQIGKLMDAFLDLHIYTFYVVDSPYLAILGDPYSIPFYYYENPRPSSDPAAEDKWIATDDYYGDLDSDHNQVELAAGRVLALSLSGTSALISRSLFYNKYMACWEADSRVSDAKDAEWKSTAYAAKGDDWNGAAWISTGDYWNIVYFLENQGYTVHTTQRRCSGATVSQDILQYYSSSSMICVMAHGAYDGYQIADSINSQDVKNWDMGPSVQVLTSCSAARTDVTDIENAISLTFIEVGVNAYIGGTRTESAGYSPDLSANVIQIMVSNDATVGVAHRDAKNEFMNGHDNYEDSAMRILYGDPSFNPYQP
jgi:hypothetical protein